MASAPHLSFLVVVFSLIILCMVWPNGGSSCCMFVGFVGGCGCMVLWGVWGCECGNIICAWYSAAWIVLGACLYMVRNSSGVSMAVVVIF